MDNIDLNLVYGLLVYGGIAYVSSLVSDKVNEKLKIKSKLQNTVSSFSRVAMMLLVAVPQQAILAVFEPQLPLLNRISVTLATYAIHFAWNDLNKKVEKAYLVWILGTALYAYHIVGVSLETAAMLVAGDSVLTIALTGLM